MSSKEEAKSQAVKEGNSKEWALAGRDGDGLKEEYGEEWSIMIVEDGGSVSPVDASHTIVHAAHPRGNGFATYIVAANKILEVRAAVRNQKYACWFVGDYCQKDGSIIFATEMDALFLALPSLEKARNKTAEHAGRFVPKDQVFVSDEGDQGLNSALANATMDLGVICDVQNVGDDKYYRLNDDKVIDWLKAKISAVIGHSYPGCDDSIPEGGWVEVQINNNGVEDKIATLEASGKAKIAKERHVFGISVVCEYVTRAWCERVVESYKMVMKDLEGVKATVSAGDEQFRTFTSGKNERDSQPTAKKPKQAASKLAKVDTKGMGSMMSFFKPKTK